MCVQVAKLQAEVEQRDAALRAETQRADDAIEKVAWWSKEVRRRHQNAAWCLSNTRNATFRVVLNLVGLLQASEIAAAFEEKLREKDVAFMQALQEKEGQGQAAAAVRDQLSTAEAGWKAESVALEAALSEAAAREKALEEAALAQEQAQAALAQTQAQLERARQDLEAALNESEGLKLQAAADAEALNEARVDAAELKRAQEDAAASREGACDITAMVASASPHFSFFFFYCTECENLKLQAARDARALEDIVGQAIAAGNEVATLREQLRAREESVRSKDGQCESATRQVHAAAALPTRFLHRAPDTHRGDPLPPPLVYRATAQGDNGGIRRGREPDRGAGAGPAGAAGGRQRPHQRGQPPVRRAPRRRSGTYSTTTDTAVTVCRPHRQTVFA